MVSIAEDAFNMFRSFFSRALLGEMIISALNTQEGMMATGLSMSISLAFAALWYGSLWPWRFEFHFVVI
jgi:hypothetical protein